MKKSFVSKGLAVLLLAALLLPVLPVSAASAGWPALSTSKYMKVYTISTGDSTPAYGSKSTSNRIGTIYAADELYVYSISGSWAYLSYPTSSGRKNAYVPLTTITSATATSFTSTTARATVTTYRRASIAASLGSISTGDTVLKIAASGSYVQVLYPISGGYKLGWVTKANYDSYIAHTHSYGGWTTSTATTCTAAGSRYRTCSCGEKQTESIASLGHNWGSWTTTKPATTSAAGSKYRQCSRCSLKETAAIPQLPSSSWRYPLNGAKCSWSDGGATWSWGEDINGNPNSADRTFHLGLDLTGSSTTVYSALEGTVAACSSSNSGANGRYVIIKHNFSGKTIYSFYAHLASVNVSNGQDVTKTTEIGVMGRSGYGSNTYYGTNPHLHFAIVNTLKSEGNYYGYSYKFSGNATTHGDVTFYNPKYIIDNNKLP